MKFAEKALHETFYLALLLRTNFLESTARLEFFRKHQPARIWISSRRLPMMHRHGWQGRRAPSNTCFAWFVWDKRSEQKRVVDWFDWKTIDERKGIRKTAKESSMSEVSRGPSIAFTALPEASLSTPNSGRAR